MAPTFFDFEGGEVLLFDKPLYWTSFDLVSKVRAGIKHHCGLKKIKVGHAGTLDPLATGLMLICTGKATKRISEFSDLDKEYLATVRFGTTTPSYDLESAVDREYPYKHITREMIEEALVSFTGEQMQEPPLFSAKLVEGKRAYELARKKINTSLKKVKIVFRKLSLIDFNGEEAKIMILCSKGTYVRAFARDLGRALDSGAHLAELVRTAIGDHRLESALSVQEFQFILKQMKQNSNLNV